MENKCKGTGEEGSEGQEQCWEYNSVRSRLCSDGQLSILMGSYINHTRANCIKAHLCTHLWKHLRKKQSTVLYQYQSPGSVVVLGSHAAAWWGMDSQDLHVTFKVERFWRMIHCQRQNQQRCLEGFITHWEGKITTNNTEWETAMKGCCVSDSYIK